MTGTKTPGWLPGKTAAMSLQQPFSAGPAAPRYSPDSHNSGLLGTKKPRILEAHPHSARRGCMSTSFIHSFPVAGQMLQASSYHSSLLPSTSTTKKKEKHKDSMSEETAPCKPHLRWYPVPPLEASPLPQQTKGSFVAKNHSQTPSPQGSPLLSRAAAICP